MIDLGGRAVLVTGASSGIGRACAVICSRLGARLALLGRDAGRLAQTLAQCERPQEHAVAALDLADHGQFDGLAARLTEKLGPFGGIVHSAGISTTAPLSALKPEHFERFFCINVSSAFLLTQALTRRSCFDPRGGSVVFISSVMGLVGERGKTLYSLTKGALAGGVRSLALELAPRRIRVNSVSPGVVATPMSEGAAYTQTAEGRERIEGLHPLGLGGPEDVAQACAFLLSDAARWVTGSNLVVDGGYSAR